MSSFTYHIVQGILKSISGNSFEFYLLCIFECDGNIFLYISVFNTILEGEERKEFTFTKVSEQILHVHIRYRYFKSYVGRLSYLFVVSIS